MRDIESTDQYEIKARGWLMWGIVQPDPPLVVGDIVRINGSVVGKIGAIESFFKPDGRGLLPGQPLGIFLVDV